MKKQLFAKILNSIGILLMITVIAAMVPLTVPKLFGCRIYGVLTESMTPAYSVGSVIYIRDCKPEDVEVGDVITFRLGSDTDYVMTHRVVEIDEKARTYTTKGDANNAEDSEPVAFERLLGRVVFSVPGLAKLAAYVDSATGKALLFIMFALAFILWVIADMICPKSKKTEKAEKPHEKKATGIIAARFAGIAMIVCACIYLGSVFLQYHRGESEYDALRQQVFAGIDEPDFGEESGSGEGLEESVPDAGISAADRQVMEAVKRLKQQNEEVIGWIVFDNMELSYPIMQGDDNAYYLKHTFSGEENSAGSIFMEAQNNSDFNDCHTIIYGHNMRNLSMFGRLKKYKAEEFYEGHEYFTIYTENEVYRYQIFAYYDISEFGDIYTIGFTENEEFKRFINRMKMRSYYDTGVEVTQDDKIITLSTCSTKGNRFVLNAKRVEK